MSANHKPLQKTKSDPSNLNSRLTNINKIISNPLVWSFVVLMLLISLSVGIVTYGEFKKNENELDQILNSIEEPTIFGAEISTNINDLESAPSLSEADTVIQQAKLETDKKIATIKSDSKKKVLGVNSSSSSTAKKAQKPATVSQPINKVNENHRLEIPFFKQIYQLSCEAASLQMALAYRGINVSQDELLAQIGNADPYDKLIQPDGTVIWGDPNLGFVGDVRSDFWGPGANFNEKLASGRGWGVNNGPIARVANLYRPGSQEVDAGNVEQLKAALREGKPVIFWHQRDDARKEFFYYKTPAGVEMRSFQNHVNLLTGYSTSGSTTYFYFNDPYYGKFKLTEASLSRWWARYQNNAVIVN